MSNTPKKVSNIYNILEEEEKEKKNKKIKHNDFPSLPCSIKKTSTVLENLSSHSSTTKGLPQASRGFAEFQRNVTPNGSTFLQNKISYAIIASINPETFSTSNSSPITSVIDHPFGPNPLLLQSLKEPKIKEQEQFPLMLSKQITLNSSPMNNVITTPDNKIDSYAKKLSIIPDKNKFNIPFKPLKNLNIKHRWDDDAYWNDDADEEDYEEISYNSKNTAEEFYERLGVNNDDPFWN